MENSIIGTEVEGYRIQEVLGRGGMGVVYKAEDIALSRNVALKRIAPSLANDESFLRRFRSEAQALARIDSPYIVSVHALRQTEIGLLIVMEHVEGGTLEDLMLEGPMDWEDALPLTKQMLKALEHAHGAEVIHRDVKPQNVMLTVEKTVKVTDFGLAKVHRGDSKATVTQGVHGTLNYMSPEQVKGSADLDHRSDLYSLGMTVYEMLAGELPFDEDSDEFAQMRTIVEDELPPPDEFNPQVPDRLSALVMRALEKDPDDRFQSAEEMREAFEESRREPSARGSSTPEPPTLAPQTTSSQEKASSEEGPRWATVAGLAVAAFLLVGIILWLIVGGEEPVPPRTQLSVSSEPPGARVFLDRNRIGTTPLTDTVEGRTARIRLQQAGFIPIVDTVSQLADRPEVNLEYRLSVKPTPMTVQTRPKNAKVYLGDREKKIGRTPVTNYEVDSRQFRQYAKNDSLLRISIQKDGYRLRDTLIAIARTDQMQLEWRLEQRPPPSAPDDSPDGNSGSGSESSDNQSKGAFTLNASPSGTVYVDGQRHTAGQSIQVTAGEDHQVRIQHPSRGACDTTLTVEAGGTETLTCYFEHEVRVRTGLREAWVNVYFGGENTDQPTPHDTLLATGKTYEIGARIQRDPDRTISGGTHKERNTAAAPNQFAGRSTTVTLRPGFERKTHIIDFQVRSEP